LIEENKLLAASGPPGDKAQFCSYIEKNINLYNLRTGVPLSTHAAANFIRGELADALRSNPYNVNILFGGMDKDGPSLYFIDYLASMSKMDFGCCGYAGYFTLSILDKNYKKGMNLEDGMKLIHTCIQELRTRFVLNTASFMIKVVDKKGSRIVESPPSEIKHWSTTGYKLSHSNLITDNFMESDYHRFFVWTFMTIYVPHCY